MASLSANIVIKVLTYEACFKTHDIGMGGPGGLPPIVGADQDELTANDVG